MLSANSTKVTLELIGGMQGFNAKSLKEFASSLNDIDNGIKTTNSSSEKLLKNANLLAKAPFVDKASLREAGKLTVQLGNSISTLKKKYDEAREASVKFLDRFGINEANGFKNTGRMKGSNLNEANRLIQETNDIKKALVERERLFKDFQQGYQRSYDRLQSLETKRSALVKQMYTFGQRSTYSGDQQQQILALASRAEQLNLDQIGKKSKATGIYSGQKGLTQVQQEFERLTGALAKQKAELTGLERAWGKFKVVFGRVIDALASFWIINTIQTLVVGFGRSLIESNAIMESSEARLKTLIVTTEKFAEVQKYLQNLTIRTPFDYQQLLDASAQARAFGIDIQRNMKSIANWASATNKDLTETATAFGKIVNYSPRTALLLSTRGLSKPLFDAYLVQYKDRELALRKMIEDNFSGMAEKISNTFQGMLTNLSDVWLFISQKLGEPIFKKLNDGLQTTFYILKKLNTEGVGFLSWTGKAIGFTASFITMFGLAVGIKYLITNIPTLITWMGKLFGIINMGALKTLGIFASIMLAIDAIMQGISVMTATRMLKEQQGLSTNGMNKREELENQREILSLQQRRYDLLDNIIYGNKIQASQQLKDIEITKKKIELLEDAVRLQQRENALVIAKGEIYENYQIAKLVKELGLRKELLAITKVMDDYVKAESLIPAPPGESRADKQARLDDLNYIQAKSIYMKAVSGEISKKEALASLKKQLLEFVAMSKMEGLSSQAIVKFMEEFNNSIKAMGELANDGKSKKGLVEYIDYLEKINGLMASSKSLLQGNDVSRANIDEQMDKVQRMMETEQLHSSINLLEAQELLKLGYQYKTVEGKDYKLTNKHNKAIEHKIELIDILLNLISRYNDKALSALDKEISKYETLANKIDTAKREWQSYRQSLLMDKRSTMSTAELQSEYDKRVATNKVLMSKFNIDPISESKNLKEGLEDENQLFKELHKNSQTWGEAYYRILDKINKEISQFISIQEYFKTAQKPRRELQTTIR